MFRTERSTVTSIITACSALLMCLPAYAFDVPVHVKITNELRSLHATVDGQQETFSDRAMQQIAVANERVDDRITFSEAMWREERHFTDERYADGSRRLLRLRQEIIDLATAGLPQGARARAKIGQALHSIQDFYAHSNWVELGNTTIESRLGEALLPNPKPSGQPCSTSPNALAPGGGSQPTSGYFVGITLNRETFGCAIDALPKGKCFHGNYTASCLGINKDLDAIGAAREGIPQHPRHAEAARLAREATKVFVQNILDDLSGNDRALSALLNSRGSLGFVIDDTRSMDSSIEGVVGAVETLVRRTESNPDLAPDDYVLVTYGDPYVGAPQVTAASETLLQAVSEIQVGGGGDCPELSQEGLLQAIGAVRTGSQVYLITDATAKDSARINQVISEALAKNVNLIYGLTGSCSPIDPVYIRAANETGGQVFVLEPADMPKLSELMLSHLSGNQALVLRRTGTVGDSSEVISLPIDATVRSITIAVSVPANDVSANHTVSLIRPSGSSLNFDEHGSRSVSTSSGHIIHVDTPEQGIWQIVVSGRGRYTATAHANSSISISRFDFVEPSGDLHGGYYPLYGQPSASEPVLGEAVMSGSYRSVHFLLIDDSGNPIDSIELTKNFPWANPEHYLGEFDLPHSAFRVAVTGVDEEGFEFLREYPAVYRNQPLKVAAEDAVVEIKPGESATLNFAVTNLGPAGEFVNHASGDIDGIRFVRPSVVNLASGGSASVAIRANVPLEAEEGDTKIIRLTSSRSGQTTTFNSASTTVVAAAKNAPPICMASLLPPVVLWPSNKRFVSIDLHSYSEVHDPDGDSLTFEALAITQDEKVAGAGAERFAPDGRGLGNPLVELRAERAGNGNGRAYEIRFRATDSHGASCDGMIEAVVPHDQSSSNAINDGQQFDSTK